MLSITIGLGVGCLRRLALIGFLLVGGLLTGGPAGAQLVDIPDVEETTSNVVGTVTSTADEVVNDVAGNQDGVVGGVTDEVDGVIGGTTEVGGVIGGTTEVGGVIGGTTGALVGGADSGSEAGDSAAPRERSARESGRAHDGSSRPQERTRFDRLPRRLETLLERIELGRNVRANLRLLEDALASASPELRARVLRLIRAEIDRLQRGGTTPRERRRIERLRLALERLEGAPAPSPKQPAIAATAGEPVVFAGSAEDPRPTAGVLGQRAERNGAPGSAPNITEPPPGDDELPFVLGLALMFLVWLGIAGVVLNNTRRPRSG